MEPTPEITQAYEAITAAVSAAGASDDPAVRKIGAALDALSKLIGTVDRKLDSYIADRRM